jgi:hypothetical protein
LSSAIEATARVVGEGAVSLGWNVTPATASAVGEGAVSLGWNVTPATASAVGEGAVSLDWNVTPATARAVWEAATGSSWSFSWCSITEGDSILKGLGILPKKILSAILVEQEGCWWLQGSIAGGLCWRQELEGRRGWRQEGSVELDALTMERTLFIPTKAHKGNVVGEANHEIGPSAIELRDRSRFRPPKRQL